MILEECERLLRESHAVRETGVRAINEADAIESAVFRLAGIDDTTDHTGFSSWTISGSGSYYNSPLEAIRAMLEKQKAEAR